MKSQMSDFQEICTRLVHISGTDVKSSIYKFRYMQTCIIIVLWIGWARRVGKLSRVTSSSKILIAPVHFCFLCPTQSTNSAQTTRTQKKILCTNSHTHTFKNIFFHLCCTWQHMTWFLPYHSVFLVLSTTYMHSSWNSVKDSCGWVEEHRISWAWTDKRGQYGQNVR